MTEQAQKAGATRKAAVIFVGNRLMRDDGIGPHAYDAFVETYEIPECVDVRDVGCMSLDLLFLVDSCDLIITVDAVEGAVEAAGSVFRC